MKPYTWSMLLLLLVFGIGWTSRVVAERRVPLRDSVAGEQRFADRESFGRRGFSRGGPFIETVEHFNEELELTDEQRASLDQIMQETMEQIRSHEHAIWGVKQQTRPRVLAILTESQRDRLDRLISVRWEERREQKVQSSLDWLQGIGDLDTASLEAVRKILMDYEEEKSTFFMNLCEKDSFPERPLISERVEALRERRDEALSMHLNPDLIEQLSDRRGQRHRSKRHERP